MEGRGVGGQGVGLVGLEGGKEAEQGKETGVV